MGKKISQPAQELIKLLFKHKECAPFNASKITAHGYAGHAKVETVIPLLEELEKSNLLKKIISVGKVKKYKLTRATEKYINSLQETEAEDEVYNEKYKSDLDRLISKHKTFILTAAVMGKEVNIPFANALRNFAERNNALKIVLPCEDVASRGRKAKPIELSKDIDDFKVVFKDTYLNNNLCLCAIKVSAKQINPLTGLDRLATSRNASIVIGAPKKFMHRVPNMHFDIPPAIMTTGAITVNNYDTDKYFSKRTSTLAENDHAYAAVIIQIENEKIFHYRYVTAEASGAFYDMGTKYNPDGTIEYVKETKMVIGDSHVGYHDKSLFHKIIELAKKVNAKEFILHDIFNGTSISHHDVKKGITKAIKASKGELNLKEECLSVKRYLEVLKSHTDQLTIVESNHDTHLLRYLEEGRYINDYQNFELASTLALQAFKGENPVKYAIEETLGLKDNSIKWLKTDESYKVYGVECGIHGSSGANGSRGSLPVFEKGIGNCVTAHTHTGEILRNACSVGTSTIMDCGYNKGLSSWSNTCCVIYPNSTKQLINFIPNEDNNFTYGG